MKFLLFLFMVIPIYGFGQLAQGAEEGIIDIRCYSKEDSIICEIANVSNESVFLIDYPISKYEDSYFDKSFGNRDILSIPNWNIPIKLIQSKDFITIGKKLDISKFKEVNVNVDFLEIKKNRYLRNLKKRNSSSILGKKLYKHRKCLFNFSKLVPVD